MRYTNVLVYWTATFESGPEVTQGHRYCHHSIVCLWFTINVLLVSKMRRFEIFAFEKYCDLKTRVSGY